MTASYRAACTDCPWDVVRDDPVEASDEMERHARKEQHHVDWKGAVATDGAGIQGDRFEVRLAAEAVPGPDEHGPVTSTHQDHRVARQEATRKAREEGRGYGVYDTLVGEYLGCDDPVEVAADGNGVVDDGPEDWCDHCQTPFQHGPQYKVEGRRVVTYHCSRECAMQWRDPDDDYPERIDQPQVAMDGGQPATTSDGETHPSPGVAKAASLLDDENQVHYSAGRGSRNSIHVDADCRLLQQANSQHSCPATNPPRGDACPNCAGPVTRDDIRRAAQQRRGGRDAS